MTEVVVKEIDNEEPKEETIPEPTKKHRKKRRNQRKSLNHPFKRNHTQRQNPRG